MMDIWQDLLARVLDQSNADSTLPTEPVRARVDPDAASALFTTDSVRWLLDSAPVHAPYVEFALGGKRETVREEGATPLYSKEHITELVEAGATVMFNLLHQWWPPIQEACCTFANEVNWPCRANAFYTPANHPGLDIHYDTDNVLAVQVWGSKAWKVAAPAGGWLPVNAEHWTPARAAETDLTRVSQADVLRLTCGDVLWVPRGWLHCAATEDTSSIHIAFGFPNDSLYDVLLGALPLMRTPELRASADIRQLSNEDGAAAVLSQIQRAVTASVHTLESRDAESLFRLTHERYRDSLNPRPTRVRLEEEERQRA